MPQSSLRRRPLWLAVGIAIFVIATVAGFAAITAAPNGAPQALGEKRSAPGSTPSPTPSSAPIVAFLGDSYTVGAGADSPLHGYAYTFAAGLGTQPINFGIGGTGYVNPGPTSPFVGRIADVVAAHPTLLIVQGSVNDSVGTTFGPQVLAAATSTLQQLKTALPKTRIVVVGPAPTPAWGQSQVGPIVASVQDAAIAVGLPFIDTTGMLSTTDLSLWAPDGIHPSTAGHAQLGTDLLAAYKALPASAD